MKVFIKTYGCQMNERDSESVLALLLGHGYLAADNEAEADVLIVNTCSVRGKAEDKAIGKLGLLAASKRKHPHRIVGAIGCMAQRRGTALLRLLPHLDFVIGTHRLDRLPAALDAVRLAAEPIVEIETSTGPRPDLAGHSPGKTSAFVNVLYGCNRHCAYCVVPLVRGEEWSRSMTDIETEVRHLTQTGVREVTLLGQSVLRYGVAQPVEENDDRLGSDYQTPFPRLLQRLQNIRGLKRIRFASAHPEGCTPELACAMRELPSVCEHLHLPLQSGSDRILAGMGRGYTSAEYVAAVARLREAAPDMALTTDVIVGFPGETTADFDATRALMDEIGFDNAFIFKYSPRPGSRAADWPDDVEDSEKRRRNQILLQEQDARCRRIYQRQIGRIAEVLVDGVSARNAQRWTGRTRDNKIVLFDPAPDIIPGDQIMIRIESARAQTLYGSITESKVPCQCT